MHSTRLHYHWHAGSYYMRREYSEHRSHKSVAFIHGSELPSLHLIFAHSGWQHAYSCKGQRRQSPY